MGAPIVTGHVVAGRYRLISALGNGGMGTVWLAEDDILSRQVAVKEVSPPADMTEHERGLLRKRTLREAQTAARLSHPNVVTIYDVVEDDGRPWIVMELIRSRSLRELVEADGPLTSQQAAGVGLQILTALNAAHALGIVHRDVKPGNVLIDTDGRAILADFGIARTQDSTALTTSGVLVGSPSYIAPELARGERGGPESDLWSLGATLYALVEGRPAYDRAGALATLMAVVNEDPDPPSRAGALWPVIRGLLDHVPARRLGPAEAERMLREVSESGGESKTAPLPAAPYKAPGGGKAAAARPGSSLEDAEHTRTLRPWDTVPAEPDSGPLPLTPDALPEAPDPQPIPGEPDPHTLPDEPDPHALPNGPDGRALPDQPGQADAGALAHAGEPIGLGRAGGVSDRAGAAGVTDSPGEAGQQGRVSVAGSHGVAEQPGARGRPDAPAAAEPDESAPEPADSDARLVPGIPFRPGTAPETTPVRPAGRHRQQLAWVLAGAAALVLVAGLVATMIMTSHHTAASPGTLHPTGRPTSSHSAAPTPSGTSAAQPTSPAPAPTSGSGPLGPATIPGGYHKFRNSTGFSIAVPNGWRVSHQGHYVYLLPPSGAEFLLIDQSDHPQPNPLRDWQQQEANRESTYPSYHRIRLESIHYPQAEKAADWEFTYNRQGVLTHVLNRNILANAHHAYALYWSTPESEWGQSWHIFKVLEQTFRPASP